MSEKPAKGCQQQQTRIVVYSRGLMALTCCEKEQVWAGEGEAVGDRAALFHEKEKQYSQSSGLIGSSRHKLDNEIGTTKDPQRGHKAL